MFLKLIIIKDGSLHTVHGKEAVELALFGLIAKEVDDVFRHDADTSRIMQRFVGIDTPHLFPVHIVLHAHGGTVIHMETQHVFIPDGIDDGIGMQGFRGLAILVQFSTKQLGCGGVSATCTGIHGKDRCASKAKHHVFLHPLGNQLMHVAKLRTMALIENQHNVLLRHHLA